MSKAPRPSAYTWLSMATAMLAAAGLVAASPAQAQASPSAEAGKIIARMSSAGAAIGTLVLVLAGYLLLEIFSYVGPRYHRA